MNITGALLVGGRSRRMGQPKSLLPRGNTTLGLYLFELMNQVLEVPSLVVGMGDLGKPVPAEQRIADRVSGAGPLAGLLGLFDGTRGSMDETESGGFLVLATDLIVMDEAPLTWLVQQAHRCSKAVLWPRFPERKMGEPLAGFYDHSAFALLQAAWDRGIRSLKEAVPQNHRWEPVIPQQFRRHFTNVNHPHQLADYKDLT